MARKKEGQDPLVQQEVRAIGSKNSDLAKSTAIEAKVSKADMTNIIKQNLLEKLGLERKDLYLKITNIDKQINLHLGSISQKLRPHFTSILSLYGIQVDKDSLYIRPSLGTNRHITIEASYRKTQPESIWTALDNLKTMFATFGVNSTRRNYEDNTICQISLPTITITDLEYNKLLDQKEAASSEIKDVEQKIHQYTDANYLRAKLDMGILAGTTNGESVVKNINLLADAILKGNTPLLTQ